MNEEIKKDIAVYTKIENVKNSPGGKLLIKGLQKDISGVIDNIATNYKTLNHIELVSLSAELSEKLEVLKKITRSSSNKKLALDALEEAERLTIEEAGA